MDNVKENRKWWKRLFDRLVMWLKWPQSVNRNYVPLYCMAWRFAWEPFVRLGLAITYALILVQLGKRKARLWWEDAT